MSADSFHGLVEKSMKKFEYKGKFGEIQNFDDFELSCKNAKRGTEIIKMNYDDFFTPNFQCTQYSINKLSPRPYIDKISHVMITKDSFDIKYKNIFDESFLSCCLFTKTQINTFNSLQNIDSDIKKVRTAPRGILKDRKSKIIKNLGKLMFAEKLHFWHSLHECTNLEEI